MAKQYASEQETLDYRVALICSVIAEVNRNRKKRNKPYTPGDFMPKKRRKKLTDSEMTDQIRAINIALGGEVK